MRDTTVNNRNTSVNDRDTSVNDKDTSVNDRDSEKKTSKDEAGGLVINWIRFLLLQNQA